MNAVVEVERTRTSRPQSADRRSGHVRLQKAIEKKIRAAEAAKSRAEREVQVTPRRFD